MVVVITGEDGAPDDVVSALAKRDTMSSCVLLLFTSAGTTPSSTTSVDTSLERSEMSTGSAAATSSGLLMAGKRATLRNLPCRSSPSSSARSRKTVSGSRPQTPLFEMFISPARCMSAMSFGSVLNMRYLENTELAVLDMMPSIPFLIASSLESISTMSDEGRPRHASLLRYSSWPCSMSTEFTVSRMSDDVR